MIELGDNGLTREEYDADRRRASEVSVAPSRSSRSCRTPGRRMLAHIATGVPAYGVTRGLGHLAGVAVSTDDQAELQRSLLTARAAGFGGPLPADDRAWSDARPPDRASSTARRASRPTLCLVIADRLNDGWSPVVPSGPYGAAGEIGPLAHLFQTLTGRGGRVRRRPPRCPPPRRSPAAGSSPTSRSRRRGSRSSTGRRSPRRSGSRSPSGLGASSATATTAAALGARAHTLRRAGRCRRASGC